MADRDTSQQQEQVSSGRHKRQTEDRMVWIGFAILLVVGGLLMLFVLGRGPTTVALGVVLLAAGLLLMLYRGMEMIERWLQKED